MPIGLTDDHEELRRTAQRFFANESSPAQLREVLDAGLDAEAIPPWWPALAELGWVGLHGAEAHGGVGFGFVELGVVVEEAGRACAPGPLVATAAAAGAIERGGAGHEHLAALYDGSVVGAVALESTLTRSGDRVQGRIGPVLAGRGATLVVTALDARTVAIVDTTGAEVVARQPVDPTRPSVLFDVDGAAITVLPELDAERLQAIAAVVAAVEAVGIAQWCVDTAATYAKDRVQFGRPIGQFQGVKHRSADMLARLELARAAAWDAARAVDDLDNGGALAIAAAGALAFDAAYENAKDCVQTLGGIGFTWEHDAHIYLRRAMALRAHFGTPDGWKRRAVDAALDGARRRLAVDLGPEADGVRDEIRAFLDTLQELDEPARRDRMAEEGYITPAWPRPYGRDAGALEQLVIEEEFRAAKIVRPGISIGAWALPNLIVYGTEAQRTRWIGPTLRGEITWCQLFSEPGAGSDLAALTTKAERVDGGWIVNGQKVWSSLAHTADWGILLARTNPDAAKHDGISCFMLDMKTPGVEPRPLRELTGHAMFNEVFFDDVFVPDDCLVGQEHDGWRCARTTLANERVFMGGASTLSGGVANVVRLLGARRDGGRGLDDHSRELGGGLVVSAHALAVLGYRLTLSALGGADPSGSEAAVRKLLGVQHDQRTQEVGMELSGADAAFADGDAGAWVQSFLFNRCLSIAGGTTEIQKNVIAERLLGLPRDP